MVLCGVNCCLTLVGQPSDVVWCQPLLTLVGQPSDVVWCQPLLTLVGQPSDVVWCQPLLTLVGQPSDVVWYVSTVVDISRTPQWCCVVRVNRC